MKCQNLVSEKNKKKNFNMSSAENFTQSAMGQLTKVLICPFVLQISTSKCSEKKSFFRLLSPCFPHVLQCKPQKLAIIVVFL